MNKLLFSFVFLSTLILSAYRQSPERFELHSDATIENDVLARYGEQVYQRIFCTVCHVQDVEQEGNGKTSLDGLGGKYSDGWLFVFLSDPRAVKPETTMPPFAQMFEKPLNPEVLKKLMQNEDFKGQSQDSLWAQLTREADLLAANMKKDGVVTPDRTEGLALIAYLQQIPASENKQRKDAAELAAQGNDASGWKNLVLDSNSVVFKTAINEKSAARGAQLFKQNCSPCHGQQAQGMIGPNLTDEYWLHGGKPLEIAYTISNGVPEMGMIAWRHVISPVQVGELTAYIRSIQGSNPENPREPQGKKQ